MTIPTISQYIESVSHPFGLFSTLNNLTCERDVYGDPILFSGGNSVVFKILSAGKQYALKCYTKIKPDVRTTYRHLSKIESTLLLKTKYLSGEIYVFGMDGKGEWYDVVMTEWAEGMTLEYELLKAIHYNNSDMFAALARNFDTLTLELLAQPWAHGDIKPANISVDNKGNMKLLDYDAMFFAEIKYETAGETGTPQYQHPLRDSQCIGKYIDDYPIALISATLHSLAALPDATSLYGSKDVFLFHPSEISAGKSAGHKAMKLYAAQRGDARLYRLLSMLESPTPTIKGLGELIAFGHENPDHTEKIETLEPFCTDSVWGYAASGVSIIPPMYDNALSFCEGLAIVELGGYRHFIDTSGRTVINCSGYEQIKPFSCGVAAVKREGLWGYIAPNGQIITKPQYGSAETFRKGIALTTTKTGRKRSLKIEDLLLEKRNSSLFKKLSEFVN